ncbi:gastrin-releasing peptide [Synchiropus splendidus]|uniref:gastrin-releasing peptide n=1 Tax=Synchiropus splendidus TaxID=270530 RepID=UPI00237DB106|nr:gastrin-releasing peptide [Synchiropus splendidus]
MGSEKMRASSLCASWMCRAAWPLFIVLLTFPSVSHCSDNPPAPEKMYPRGNHWAVGHLMGKKSVGSQPRVQDTDDRTVTSSDSEMSELLTIKHLLEALMLQKSSKQMTTTADKRLRWSRSGWRDKDRNDYLQEMSDLLLLMRKLQESDSTSVQEEY